MVHYKRKEHPSRAFFLLFSDHVPVDDPSICPGQQTGEDHEESCAVVLRILRQTRIAQHQEEREYDEVSQCDVA